MSTSRLKNTSSNRSSGMRSKITGRPRRRERTAMNNILLIDDNVHLLGLLATVIGTLLKDCNILTARNGAQGIAMIDSRPIALILTDLDMPVIDGYGVI